MKVIFDIMALGAGYAKTHGRTGIFRVVENIAQGLMASPNCEPEFISTAFYQEAAAFLKETEHFNRYTLKYPSKTDIFINRVYYNLGRKESRAKGFSKALISNIRTSALPENSLSKLSRKADIYHSPYMPIPQSIRQSRNIKRFLTVHDLIAIRFPEYFENNADPLVKHAIASLAENDWAFCVSQSTKNDLCNYAPINPDRVFVSYLAASHDIFYPCTNSQVITDVKEKYQLGEESYFLSLCTLEPRKNVAHTIRCFIKLIKQQNLGGVNLVLAGTKGWDFDDIFQELKDPALRSRIVTTGFVADTDLAALYSGALAFVYPSFYEGFGLPPLEALQCGTPVITSNVSSLPEVVEDAGITLSPTDQDALCQAMLDLYNHSELRKQLSEKAIVQAAKFSWDNCLKSTLHAYQTALNS